MAYSLRLVIKKIPGSFKQVIKKTIYCFLPSKCIGFYFCGLMIHLLSVLIASGSSEVNHSQSKKKKTFFP